MAARLADGVLLCEAAAAVAEVPVPGVTQRPVTQAARAGNVGRALATLRRLPGMPTR